MATEWMSIPPDIRLNNGNIKLPSPVAANRPDQLKLTLRINFYKLTKLGMTNEGHLSFVFACSVFALYSVHIHIKTHVSYIST